MVEPIRRPVRPVLQVLHGRSPAALDGAAAAPPRRGADPAEWAMP